MRCFAPQWARFDNRQRLQRTRSYPRTASAAAAQEVQAIPRTDNVPAAPIPRDQHRQICTCPPRAKGPLDRRSKRLSFPHFFLRRKKCGRRRAPPRQGKANSPLRRRKRSICLRRGQFRAPARATFVCGDKSSQKHRLDLRSKNPSRAILSCDFLRILAGIAFCRRCRSKGLRVRSPARRLPRPLAPATVGVFRSYRRTPKPSH